MVMLSSTASSDHINVANSNFQIKQTYDNFI